MRIACIVASVPDTVMRALLDPAGQLADELHRLDLVLGGEARS